MTVIKSLNAMRQLAMAFPHEDRPWEDRPTFTQAPGTNAINKFEHLAGFSLPDDLRVFFSEVDAVVAMSIHNGYWVGGVEQLSQSIRRGDFPASVNGTPVAPIATDGGGNAFLMEASGRVWRWRHDDRSVAAVSMDFSSFLARIVDDFRASHHDTPNWTYLV